MREERLLERIRRWEKEPVGRGREDPKRVLDSVVRHLQRLLNTRQGSVQIADDYGIPDVSHLLQHGPQTAFEVEKALQNLIEKFEPRLTNVRVRYVSAIDNRFALSFHVQAKLKMDAKSIVLETLVGADGRIQVTN